MRPTFVHVLTGLLLGTALAGLLNVPGQVLAHQESVPPVRAPIGAKPATELVVRVSPKVERALAAERAKRAAPRQKPRVVPVFRSPVLVRAQLSEPVASSAPPAPQAVPKPKKPAPPPSPPPPPKIVAGTPPPPPAPPPPPPPPDEDEDEDDDDDDDDDEGDDDDDNEHDDDRNRQAV